MRNLGIILFLTINVAVGAMGTYIIRNNSKSQTAAEAKANQDLVNMLTAAAVANANSQTTSSSGETTPTPTAQTYTISGTITGLYQTKPVVIHNNGGDDVTITGTFATITSDVFNFTFPTKLNTGATYSITATFPQGCFNPCVITNGTGTVGISNITNVTLSCGYIC